MRLIDADELRLLIQREYNTDDSDYPTQYQFGLHFAMNAIDEAQTVEPQRIKGRWKRTKANSGYNAEWVCSNCGCTIYAEFCNYNYCSSCGSDMRGD